MKDQLVSFKVAKLAKEKRFNEETKFFFSTYEVLYKGSSFDGYPAPTQSLLQKWLRQEHFIEIEIRPLGYHSDNHWAYRGTVIKYREKSGPLPNKVVLKTELLSDIEGDYYIFRSYEAILEKALEEALNLIQV